ncbi:predicted protein [Uncinocarpus reesii 1704]|uniref:Uncharacterized protein n=1 Tax=Uncinocarpus reesii (strain UAMH 1704) TaxID=336963 RepID=C4JM70_UNCRE|nr:uncharacterized protein UREG_03928 [Uncinocarpus reesii 1704]EEP79082.1 predicted protein [Uncinocarpus reesii 1704]
MAVIPSTKGWDSIKRPFDIRNDDGFNADQAMACFPAFETKHHYLIRIGHFARRRSELFNGPSHLSFAKLNFWAPVIASRVVRLGFSGRHDKMPFDVLFLELKGCDARFHSIDQQAQLGDLQPRFGLLAESYSRWPMTGQNWPTTHPNLAGGDNHSTSAFPDQ